MQLINKQRYKIIIAEEPEVLSRGIAGLYIPILPLSEGGDGFFSDKDIEEATNYVNFCLEKEWSDESQSSETESGEDDDDNWSPSPTPMYGPYYCNQEYEEDSIDDEELQELITVLDNIVRTNPRLLNDPRPVIDLDIYKYGSYVSGTDELVWEFEYCIHEDPLLAYAAG